MCKSLLGVKMQHPLYHHLELNAQDQIHQDALRFHHKSFKNMGEYIVVFQSQVYDLLKYP